MEVITDHNTSEIDRFLDYEMGCADAMGEVLQRTFDKLMYSRGLGEQGQVWDEGLSLDLAKARGALEPTEQCSICLCTLGSSSAATGSGVSAGITLLSCSHVFHAVCLDSLEKYCCTSGTSRKCPVCRTGGYHRKNVVIDQTS